MGSNFAPITGACHCGKASFIIHSDPQYIVECNCSICRRFGALWVHSRRSPNLVLCGESATFSYVWGDREISFHICQSCGCLVFWKALADDEMAVNARLCCPQDFDQIPIRKFDGAVSFTFTDVAK